MTQGGAPGRLLDPKSWQRPPSAWVAAPVTAALLFALGLPGGPSCHPNPCLLPLDRAPAVAYFARHRWRDPATGTTLCFDLATGRVSGTLEGPLNTAVARRWAWFPWTSDGVAHELRLQCRPADGHVVAPDWASVSLDGAAPTWWRRVDPARPACDLAAPTPPSAGHD